MAVKVEDRGRRRETSSKCRPPALDGHDRAEASLCLGALVELPTRRLTELPTDLDHQLGERADPFSGYLRR